MTFVALAIGFVGKGAIAFETKANAAKADRTQPLTLLGRLFVRCNVRPITKLAQTKWRAGNDPIIVTHNLRLRQIRAMALVQRAPSRVHGIVPTRQIWTPLKTTRSLRAYFKTTFMVFHFVIASGRTYVGNKRRGLGHNFLTTDTEHRTSTACARIKEHFIAAIEVVEHIAIAVERANVFMGRVAARGAPTLVTARCLVANNFAFLAIL
mmetsp:Transcript_24321/g.69918  ORF Transcript_24321/g.69918 Transcript_24321/m.69918 type:complete len:209 (-) Transcript_24321:610-1236(-)